ncbi:MAG TPA: ABC transporter ATP-binding protein [Stellaceae bacterium]|nr:ABC transporter ATP-binding protein [Stellaceae bacterium]
MSSPGGSAAGVPRLELRGITKRYPGTVANRNVDLTVMPGELHALLGENGAGKSTLVKIIYGVVGADEGEIRWQGAPIAAHDPASARRLGIGMVFQHFTLFETLTVTENIALGLDDQRDMRALRRKIDETAKRYGMALDPDRYVHDLAVGERQRVEIVRCLMQEPKLLIMDEPTSVLTPQEVERLFDVLRRLADEGCSILYISHKLGEIMALCQRATVLRQGAVTAQCDPRQETSASLARMMVGSDVLAVKRPAEHKGEGEALTVTGLTMEPDDPFGARLDNISLALRKGEILGIAGVAGNGQTEFLHALAGERLAPRADAIRFDGKPAGHLGPAGRRARGLAFVPEERLGRGAVAELSLADNALLTAYLDGNVGAGMVKTGAVRHFAGNIVKDYNVVCAGIDAEARSLSGGNMQKFIIGREILQKPRVLIAAHPTWGVDVGAALTIHEALIRLRDTGAAVLVVSEDLDELFEICDRIAVMSHGRLSEPKRVADTNIDEIGLLMGGEFGDDKQAGTHAAT